MLHPATQATLSSILLSGVQGYTQSTPSPPPGLAPIDKQPNGVPDCTKGPCTLNGHVKVSPLHYTALISDFTLNVYFSKFNFYVSCTLCMFMFACMYSTLAQSMGGWRLRHLQKLSWVQPHVTQSRRPADTIHQNRCPASPAQMKVLIWSNPYKNQPGLQTEKITTISCIIAFILK